MRRITLWLVGTLSGLILLLSYRTSTMGAGIPVAAPTTPSTTSGTSSGSASSGSTSSGSGSSAATSFTGTSVDTQWGPVQVLITVSDGKITKAEAVVYPQNNGRDLEINARALPVLAEEVVKAQSADIDTVSGATVTSDGYVTSLQSAIDQAHLGS